jgi:dipeptidyl aminopeptidase/acylaminoacyl peptidase
MPTHVRVLVFGVLGGLSSLSLHGQQARTNRAVVAMTLVDVLNVPDISEPQISPDGRQLLCQLAVAEWKQNRHVSHVWRIDLDGRNAVQLTNGREGESMPRWSPDGRTIAFLARRGEDGTATQIHLISNAGGEAKQLSTHATSVSNIARSPDGAWMYFLAADPKTDAERARDRAKDDVYAFNENSKQQHLWKIAIADASERRVTEGNYWVSGYRLAPDGRVIVHHRQPNPLLDSSADSEIWIMDNSGGSATRRWRVALW